MRTFFAFSLLMLVGCRGYNVPKYEEVGTSETAFLIPLDGNTETQKKFESEELLRKSMISTKRLEIPRYLS